MAIRKTTNKKRKQDLAINYRLKNPHIKHDTIVEKIGLDMSVPAFRKACSRAKKDDSLDPTPAKAPPTSEPAAPTSSKYPKGEFHDQVMAAASL